MAPGSKDERGRDGCMVLRACRNHGVSFVSMWSGSVVGLGTLI